jgi:electron transfer flavoprotein beta subunit
MGPVRAAEVLREGLFRGADDGILLTDRAFAGADTLATSYALACAVRKIKNFDLIISGRQAIDGDTAQVGPQVAEKLGLAQITYAEEIISVKADKIRIKRRLERGIEVVEGKFPIVVTVNSSAANCRPRNAKLLMKYKHATTISERADKTEDYMALVNEKPYLSIKEWSVNDIECEREQLGLSGSPTKVKKIENIVFQAKESKKLTESDKDINELMKELIENHTIG